MVKLTVFLVRHGQCLHEVEAPPSNALVPLYQFRQPDVSTLQQIMKRLDPELTELGYRQAEDSFRALANAFRSKGDVRKFGYYSSPFKRCAASALMISSAGFEPEDWSTWGLTTPGTQKAPTAIPIAVVNGLADCTKEIMQLGGLGPVLDAGLLLCSACPWNKAYKKDPLMGEIQRMKDLTGGRIEQWVDHSEGEHDRRFVADVQYLRFENESDPYSLTQMSMKFNVITELIRPNKFMQPPRKGCYQSKPQPAPVLKGQESLDYAVSMARQTGCDTIILVVTSELIQGVCDRAGTPVGDAGPGDIAVLYAETSDSVQVSWTFHSMTAFSSFSPRNIPRFPGPITASVEPPAEFAQAMEECGEDKWGSYPPPPPENIPSSYPKDIPSFGSCLSQPEPTQKWSYVSKPPKI
jgi:hypothetical protein